MEGKIIIRAHLQCFNGNEYTFGGDNSGKLLLSLLKRCLFYKKIIYPQREQILGVHYSKRKATRASPFAEIAKYLPIIYQESTLHSAVELKFFKRETKQNWASARQNLQYDLCDQERLRIVSAFAQSDQSSLIAYIFYSLWAIQSGINENPCHTWLMYTLIWVFTGNRSLIYLFIFFFFFLFLFFFFFFFFCCCFFFFFFCFVFFFVFVG